MSNIKRKCFVVATEVSRTEPIPYLLSTYPAPIFHNSRITNGKYFQSAHTYECENMPLWSAARATSATPNYFQPYVYQTPNTTKPYRFVDGGLVANCPMEFAIQDAWAMYPGASLAYIVSFIDFNLKERQAGIHHLLCATSEPK